MSLRAPRRGLRLPRSIGPAAGLAALVVVWQCAVAIAPGDLLPGVPGIARALGELLVSGMLPKYVVASLFRVGWGFVVAVVAGVTLALLAVRFRRFAWLCLPVVHLFRPVSAFAWIPFTIHWFGVGDLAAIAIIAISIVWPITLQAYEAFAAVPELYQAVGRNVGLGHVAMIREIIVPAAAPELLAAARVTLGIAWMVDVAAEMLAVNSGLGFLIVDARNAGDRYDLVMAAILCTGLIGLALDRFIRDAERRLPGVA